MFIGSLFGRLRGCLARFGRSERGNVAITFGFALVPLITLVGAAVDYSRGNSAKVAMQAANDATALMLSKEAQKLGNGDALKEKASEIFKSLIHRPDVTSLTVTPNYTDGGTGNFKLTVVATATVPTTFTRVIGHQQINLGVSSEVVWGVKKLELAMALDVTGSMAQSNKIAELKKAAKGLLTTLKSAAKKDGDIKIAIAPFAVNVNVGTSNVNASWLDWSDWSSAPAIITGWQQDAANQNAWKRAGPGARCPFRTGSPGFSCTNGPADKQNDSTVSTIPSSGTYNGLICPSRDDGSRSAAVTGVLTNRYYSGCYTPGNLRPDSEWQPLVEQRVRDRPKNQEGL
jgi:Flp pilus assembly protein TadG